VLVVHRFRVSDSDAFREELQQAHAWLARQAGHREGRLGRNIDDPDLWVLTMLWDGPGAYRRALSSYDVKLHAWPTLAKAFDEPGAYEVVDPDTVLNVAHPRVT
jgi:quinol monooxygenase YgiN